MTSNMRPTPTCRAASRHHARTGLLAHHGRRVFDALSSSTGRVLPTRGRKRLAVMNQDGAGVNYHTRGDDLAVTPRFSPSSPGRHSLGVRRRRTRVMLMNLDTRQRRRSAISRHDIRAALSPDGQKIIMSLSNGSASTLWHVMESAFALDDPADRFQRDRHLAFLFGTVRRSASESDRGGTQIYMSASGGGAKRISFGDGHYSTPVWSPKGDFIAFTRQSKNGFGIGVMKPDGSGEGVS